MEAVFAPTLIDGRYRALRVLGEGSFARTLACEDMAEGQRPVAVKQLRVSGLGDWKPVDLFQREARVLESLRHQSVPEIYRHFEGRDDEGRLCLYLVMELIDGSSLLQQLRDGRRFRGIELTELTLALLDVLEYLHGRSPPVFHRDIKPSNIVLRPSGAPVLVDFGGVCHGWRPAQGGSTVTGTFGYMPPEQLLGQVSPASDLYAFGATLLHLVTGREPTEFSYDSGRLSLPPEATGDLPAGFARFLHALLEPAPRDRPVSARAARRLLLEGGGEVPPRPLAPIAGRALVVMSGGGRPEMIDLGPPPRDPDGTFADVFANLIEIYDGRRGPAPRRGGIRAIGRVSLATLIAVASLGIWPAFRTVVYRSRRRLYGPLFRTGVAVAGQLVGVSGDDEDANISACLTYEYDVAGRRYRDRMDTSLHVAKHWAVGDPVTVLHAPANPHVSCVVYRWST